jgi:hypothetical protein
MMLSWRFLFLPTFLGLKPQAESFEPFGTKPVPLETNVARSSREDQSASPPEYSYLWVFDLPGGDPDAPTWLLINVYRHIDITR